jgi:hypothetical protein
MKSFRHLRRGLGAFALMAAVVAIPAGVTPAAVHAADTPLAGGGEFHPLAPARIYDSRVESPVNEASPGPKPISTGTSTFDIQVLGLGGIPADSTRVLAVALSITVSQSTSPGVLAAYGTGHAPATLTSLVNFNSGAIVPNLGILSPDPATGKLTIALYGGTGTAQVLVDVFGWFSNSNEAAGADNGSRFIPITPGRILDTRDGTNIPGGKAPIGPSSTVTVPVRGVGSVSPTVANIVPNDANVVGVMLNVVGITARPGGVDTYLAVTPEDIAPGAHPTTSNLNLTPNQIKANLVMVPVGADGNVHIYNLFGNTDVAVDVVGYLLKGADPATFKGRVVPLSAPYRTFDTREQKWGAAPLGPGMAESWSFADFAASVKINGQSVGVQSAVIGNLTNASVARQYASVPVLSYLTAWPTGQQRPMTSNIDTDEGPASANMAVLTYGPTNTVQFYNYAGKAHYLFDASAVVLADA